MSENALPKDERVWEAGWDDHRRKQMLRMSKLTFAQKLAWLEEAHRMVLHMRKSREENARKQAGDSKPA